MISDYGACPRPMPMYGPTVKTPSVKPWMPSSSTHMRPIYTPLKQS